MSLESSGEKASGCQQHHLPFKVVFLSPVSWKSPCGFYSSNEQDPRVLGEIGACVEGRAENQVCVNACVICVHRGLVAIADMVSFWVKHKAELEHPRGR